MAKFTPFFGNISGKLNSVVFAYNKAGQYIRSWRASTKPKSIAQIAMQAIFTGSVSSWHGLTDPLKGQWNTYAANFFSPKHPKAGAVLSGYNAFVSMNTLAANLELRAGTATITSPAAVTSTPVKFATSDNPPAGSFSAAILASDSTPLNLMLNNVQYSLLDGCFTSEFSFIGNHGTDISGNGPNFLDAISNVAAGIVIYGSKPTDQLNQFVSNPEYGILTAIDPQGQLEDWTDSATIQFNSPTWQNKNDRKEQLMPDEKIQAFAYLVGQHGQTQPLNAVRMTVSA